MKYFLTLFFLLAGCAQPNYQNQTEKQQQLADGVYTLSSPALNLLVDLVFDKAPNDSEENFFTIRFHHANDDTTVVIDQNIAVVLWMPSMGHGSSPVKIEKKSDGSYHVSKVYFIMPGDWEIRLQIKDKETANVIEQITQKLDI